MSTQDKAANIGDKLKGKAKEAAGKVTGNQRLEAEGKADQAKGDIKQAGEKIKDALKD
ncbi:CsbD family protein [Streptomyces paludis]|uniref:CsbD family protein n=1 Tax=Streptomyces paludis TaxID=2282738 RepID=A0A345HQD2_9ACTN|nr:CsbD family protein [Streptomyces paludis]AXG78906.1 CsbD family protein [Streptomyces paludis]